MDVTGFRELFVAAQSGDESAQERFYENALRIALAVARQRMQPSDRALLESLDIQQSVLLRLHRRLPDLHLESEAQLIRWLLETASRVLQEKRRDARRARRDARRNVPYPTGELSDPAARSVQEALLRIQVEEVLGHLPEDARDVVRLKMLEGRSFAEVAQITGLSGPDAARKRCARALLKLEELLPHELTHG